MHKDIEIISVAVALIVKATILATGFSGRVRKRSFKRLAEFFYGIYCRYTEVVNGVKMVSIATDKSLLAPLVVDLLTTCNPYLSPKNAF